MRKIILALLFAGGLTVGTASAASAMPPEQACGGLERAHSVVPHDATTAHASIPHCMEM